MMSISHGDSAAKPLRAVLWCAVSDEKQAREEKIGLAEQERLLREKAEGEGWLIVDILIVPGFSRRFYNYPEFMAAALKDGIEAPKRLMEHWNAGDFDVLACRYGSRFAREQSIFGEVVARTIDMGDFYATGRQPDRRLHRKVVAHDRV
jgi:hypothetical protein